MSDQIDYKMQTVMEWEIAEELTTEFERTLGNQMAELLDAAYKEGATVDDAVGAVGKLLHTLASRYDAHPPEEGQIMVVTVEPFECGCLFVEARHRDARPHYDDPDDTRPEPCKMDKEEA